MSDERVIFQDLGLDWVAEMQWLGGDESQGPAALLIRPADPDSIPPGGLSSTVLRQVNFREASADLQRQRAADKRYKDGEDRYQAERIQRIRDQLSKGVSPEYLALLASLYIYRVKQGQPKPVEGIAEDLGRGLQTIRGHLWQARTQGLLEGSAGRKGGRLTPTAKKILEQIVPNAPKRLGT
ncbi:hypothetical protein [Mycobacterium sp. NPDC050853]|uniref:hypothetical protein n=1 Tax=Mycobacterium sp. NPDC050853 TaxID=3155160 RepID=UPI0033DBFD17